MHTTTFSICLSYCRLLALAWLVRQLRACYCCIGMVQYFFTHSALGWGKAAQMLQGPCLWVGGRLGPVAGSLCQALIPALDRLHRTKHLKALQRHVSKTGMLSQGWSLNFTPFAAQQAFLNLLECALGVLVDTLVVVSNGWLHTHVSDRNEPVPSFT